jgi:arabinan endo-1,5-alpha-L-arabinosidase
MHIISIPSRKFIRGMAGASALALAASIAACGDSDPASSQSAGPSGSTTSTASTGGTGGAGGEGVGGNGGAGGAGGGGAPTAMYTNPLTAAIEGGGVVENCPDPAVIYAKEPGDEAWYVFCTADPLNDQDKDASNLFIEHRIPILRSKDLVSFSYVGDALSELPSYAAADADLWAPEIQYFNGQYFLYFVVTNTLAGGNAIGVATSKSPAGPWTHAETPTVEPHPAPCCAGSKRWVYDPYVLLDEGGKKYIYYGSYFGGLSVRSLSDDGMISDPVTQVEVAIPNRYEGAYVQRRGEWYYLFGSASDCCNGPLSGYSVFAGRSKSPLGPFVDKDGVPLLAGRVGGTPVLSMNGNRWVGAGHNAVLTDFAGQDWIIYHAIDVDKPYFEKSADPGLWVKRRLMMDPLDWIDGWPTVRGGHWASDAPQPGPAAQPGQKSGYQVEPAVEPAQDDPKPDLSDEFDGASLGAQWTWIREPAAEVFGLEGGALRFTPQSADLHMDSNNAAVLHEAAPSGDYMVEAKVTLDVPAEGCCFNFTQAGLVIYKDDDNYVKLASASIWDTRQIEFAKELIGVPQDYPRYGATVVGSAAKTLWLRIVRRAAGSGEMYTAYESHDGSTWVRGGTWTHNLGAGARIGLVSMGAPSGQLSASFDYVRVYGLKP